jgi:hypothetical protein
MRRMFDAAYPEKVIAYGIPPIAHDWLIVAGYIGGNTPHVWTDAEWAQFPQPYRLPIFTRSTGGDPVDDANHVIQWMTAHHVPAGSTVALDFEKRVDGDYLRKFDSLVVQAGWKVMLYGQLSTIFGNPRPSGGYWVAHWTGVEHMEPGAVATQWSGSGSWGGAYDPNIVSDTVQLWQSGEIDMDYATFKAFMMRYETERQWSAEPTAREARINTALIRQDMPTAEEIAQAILAALPSPVPGGMTVEQIIQAVAAAIVPGVKVALREGTG